MLPLLAIILYQGKVLGIEVDTTVAPWRMAPMPEGALYLGVCMAPWPLELDWSVRDKDGTAPWQSFFQIPPHVAAQFWNGYRTTPFAESMLPETRQTKMVVGHA